MNRRYAIAGVGVVLALAGVGWWWTASDPAPAGARHVEGLDGIERSEAPPPPPVAVDPARKPPEHRREGIERDDISRIPPLDDGAAWQQQRARAARDLHEGQLAATEAFAEQEGLTVEQTEAIVAAVDDLHIQLRSLKQQVETGALPASELRQQTPQLRATTAERVRAAIGPMATAALRTHLADDALGGGF